ncbi:MAG: hypothetical protein KBT46_01470 [Ruminococcus sp.]|nr:hypothetical protein [Candidatus Copronaster equi]
MVPVYLRMIITALLSLISVLMFCIYKTEVRKNVMLAMLLSSVGDVFMVNSASIGVFSTYIGAAIFIAAHLVYGESFRKQIKSVGEKPYNIMFFIGIAIMITSAVVLGVLAFTVADEKKPIMFVLILFYIAAIGYNVCMNFSYAKIAGGTACILPFAILAFYLTDIFIFEDMLNIDHSMRKFVWLIYPEAQLLLILFNSGLKRKKIKIA